MERDMFDTMTMTKILGGLCGTLLIFLLGGWAAELIYHGGGGHDDHEQAYVIEVEGGEAEEVAEEMEVPFEQLYAAATADAGEAVFRNCRACHAVEAGQNGTGPYLHGVVGRAVGAAEGFGYSGALSEAADVWTPEELNAFLEDPKGYAPGTSMSYNGLRDPEDRANLIAYLDSLDG